MAITLTLTGQQIQDSVQKGDIIYYATPTNNNINILGGAYQVHY